MTWWCGAFAWPRFDVAYPATKMSRLRTAAAQRPDHEVERHRRVRGFHVRNRRLAPSQPLRRGRLRLAVPSRYSRRRRASVRLRSTKAASPGVTPGSRWCHPLANRRTLEPREQGRALAVRSIPTFDTAANAVASPVRTKTTTWSVEAPRRAALSAGEHRTIKQRGRPPDPHLHASRPARAAPSPAGLPKPMGPPPHFRHPGLARAELLGHR